MVLIALKHCAGPAPSQGRAEEGTVSAQGDACIMNDQACPQLAKRGNKTEQ